MEGMFFCPHRARGGLKSACVHVLMCVHPCHARYVLNYIDFGAVIGSKYPVYLSG